MQLRPLGVLLLALATTAALAAQQTLAGATQAPPGGGPQGRGAKPPGPKRAVIVTGENSYNGHVWKETSAELKTILDAGAVATSNVHFADFPMALELQYGRSRVFNTTMGHDVKALRAPGTAELIRRGTAWAAGVLK
jgi:hypothetical protein